MARNRIEENERSTRRHKFSKQVGRYDLAGQDGQRIVEAIDRLTDLGAAIRIGRTRDGGALAVGVYGDGGQPYTDFLRPGESLLEYLDELRDALTPDRSAK